MKKINLREFYPDVYTTDFFVDVTEEVMETTIFDKSRNLYGLNVARTTRKNYLILCEGYMDVISMQIGRASCRERV